LLLLVAILSRRGSVRLHAAATSIIDLKISVIGVICGLRVAQSIRSSEGIVYTRRRTFHDGLSEMLSRSSEPESHVLPADALSEVLQDLRLSGVSYGRCDRLGLTLASIEFMGDAVLTDIRIIADVLSRATAN
jgi:hypothetical protein